MASLCPAPEHLGVHHFAYLRSVAEGIPIADAARKYLGISHGAEAITAHRLTVDHARAIARRHGDSRWRLVGIEIRERELARGVPPLLEQWAEAEGLEGWSYTELQAMYAERFGDGEADVRRRQLRNARLRESRLALLFHRTTFQ